MNHALALAYVGRKAEAIAEGEQARVVVEPIDAEGERELLLRVVQHSDCSISGGFHRAGLCW
jgi:hypothetical protein